MIGLLGRKRQVDIWGLLDGKRDSQEIVASKRNDACYPPFTHTHAPAQVYKNPLSSLERPLVHE